MGNGQIPTINRGAPFFESPVSIVALNGDGFRYMTKRKM